jgi:hypothetical protein
MMLTGILATTVFARPLITKTLLWWRLAAMLSKVT